jgi:uncharacterized repeat protein (TIGR01451 family)
MNPTVQRTLASSLIAAAMALLVLAPATTAMAATADVSVDLTVSPTSGLDTNGNVTYAAAVHNAGPDAASSVALVVTLPSGIIPISATPHGSCAFNAAGTTVDCAQGTIASGTTATATIVVHPVTIGMKTASAQASAAETDPDPGNNTHTASSTLTEVGISEVQVTLTDGPDPLNVGETLTYTAVVTNIQDDSAQKVVLSVVLPMSVTYSSGSSDRGFCGRILRLVTCRLGTLNPGIAATATIKVVPNNPGFLHAAAGVAVGTADPSFANNSAAVRTWVNP